MNTTLYLVRHGEAVKPRDSRGRQLVYGPHARLTALGIDQMKYLAHTFRHTGVEFDEIISSTTTRAEISATILYGELGSIGISVDARLRASYMPGMYYRPEADFGHLQSIYDETATEPIVHANRRIQNAVYRIVKKHRGETIALVTHSEQIALLDGNWNLTQEPILGVQLENGSALKWVLDGLNNIREKEVIIPGTQSRERS